MPDNTPAAGSPTVAPVSGGVKAPIGAEPTTPVTKSAAPAGEPKSASEARTLSDDDLVLQPGSDKPIKYGDLYKRMQGDLTRKQQALAREREQWSTERSQQEQHLQSVLAAAVARQQSGGGAAGADPGDAYLQELATRPYISGAELAPILQQIRTQGFGGLAKAIQDRDTVIVQLHQAVKALQQTVGISSNERAEQQFGQKVDQWLQELGLPPEAKDLAIETYLAHEGDNLDEEFPDILRSRWETLQRGWQNQEKARVEAARNSRFTFPTRGGSAVPSKPLQLSGRETAQEQAEVLWDLVHAADGSAT